MEFNSRDDYLAVIKLNGSYELRYFCFASPWKEKNMEIVKNSDTIKFFRSLKHIKQGELSRLSRLVSSGEICIDNLLSFIA